MPAHVRSLVRIVVVASLAAVVLASCATTAAVVQPHVSGLPAISISVPLSSVACTTDNACVALGTSNLDVSPTSVGEYRSPNGHWATITVPSADTSTYVQASSCWNVGCLFVGSRSNADLVWRFDAKTATIRVLGVPAGGSGVEAISCYGSMTCAVLDATTAGPRFLTTMNGGATWSPVGTVGVAAHATVTSLACTSALKCIASFLNASSGIAVYVTTDGGSSWTPRSSVPTLTWSSLTSLNCAGTSCVGLAKLDTGWRIVHTRNFGTSWSKVAALRSSNLTLACTSLQHCVVAGVTSASAPWLATVHDRKVSRAKLQYVPSSITNVACGSKVCAAIGVTTVLTVKP